jgi:cyclopropane fatty-acyl-phospholipid synthase-like methyltransferase
MRRRQFVLALCSSVLLQRALAQQTRTPDVVYLPTPPTVVQGMLKLANITKNDVVYDLGCGDGRIVIEAARRYGVRAVGIDIDPKRIAEARANAKAAGVENRVEFRVGDLFEADLRGATVVTLYLLPRLNMKLMPKLQRELSKGARIVSHAFDMDEWKPDQEADVNGNTVYLWIVK